MELPEPAAGVVEDPIERDPQPAAVGDVQQFAQRVVAAEEGVDMEVVVGVIAMVGGRLEDRRQVDRGDPKALQVIEFLEDAQEVAALDPVVGRRGVPRLEWTGLRHARASGESIREDLVEDCVPDPGRRIDAHRRRWWAAVLPGAGPVDPRTTSRVSRRRWTGRA